LQVILDYFSNQNKICWYKTRTRNWTRSPAN